MEWLSNNSIYSDFIRPILDILILSLIIYYVYRILVQTRAIQLVKGALLMALIYAVAFFFQLTTLLWIMNSLATVLVIIIAIVFQPELRSIFTRIGQSEWFRITPRGRPYQLDSILNAVEILSGLAANEMVITNPAGLKSGQKVKY